MSLKIRMARGGAKSRPFYNLVVAESRSPRDGRFIEKIGTYNPMLGKDDEKRCIINADRAKYWMGVGALPSDRIARLMAAKGLCEMPKWNETPKKSAPKAKAQERMKAAAGETAAPAAEAPKA